MSKLTMTTRGRRKGDGTLASRAAAFVTGGKTRTSITSGDQRRVAALQREDRIDGSFGNKAIRRPGSGLRYFEIGRRADLNAVSPKSANSEKTRPRSQSCRPPDCADTRRFPDFNDDGPTSKHFADVARVVDSIECNAGEMIHRIRIGAVPNREMFQDNDPATRPTP